MISVGSRIFTGSSPNSEKWLPGNTGIGSDNLKTYNHLRLAEALVGSGLLVVRIFFAERTWRVACTFFKELVEMRNVLKTRGIRYRRNTAVTQQQCARLADAVLVHKIGEGHSRMLFEIPAERWCT